MSADPQIFNVVLGTAGHIDHGKSTLVQALTGIHPDRLKEEQDRGITIDIGFAPLELKNGLRVGIIDVPGHERFIKNMVAGATGVDFVMMVVAADDSVMAQTREHLQIVQLLSVRDGLTVITKKDLVEADHLELVVDDVQKLIAGTVLEGKPIIPVSSKTGVGIEELKVTLENALSRLTRKDSSGPFRMPIQRVFAKEGFGTVVTGVPITGHVAIGDTIEILPPGYSGRVKGLHAYKTVISQGRAGHSTAVNLHGPQIDKKEVIRGMVAATPGIFRPTTLLTAHLTHLSGTPWPLKHRAPVRYHSGTAEIQGKVLLLEGDQMPAGTVGCVQIALEEPTVAAPGDRFILRHQTPMVTLGGGRIVDVHSPKLKRQQPDVIAQLDERLKCLEDPRALISHILSAAGGPKTLQELCAECALLSQTALDILNALIKEKKVDALKPGAVFIDQGALDPLAKTIRGIIEAFLKEHAALGGIDRPELKRKLESLAPAVSGHFDDLLVLLSQKTLIKTESNLVTLPGRDRKLEGALAEQTQKVEEQFVAGALTPPTFADVEAGTRIPAKTLKEIRRFLLDTGRLVEASPDVYFHASAFDKAKAEVLKLFAQKPQCTTSEIRQHLNMNRKFVVPLVELFDKKGLTVRVGDVRKLK